MSANNLCLSSICANVWHILQDLYEKCEAIKYKLTFFYSGFWKIYLLTIDTIINNNRKRIFRVDHGSNTFYSSKYIHFRVPIVTFAVRGEIFISLLFIFRNKFSCWPVPVNNVLELNKCRGQLRVIVWIFFFLGWKMWRNFTKNRFMKTQFISKPSLRSHSCSDNSNFCQF